MESGKNVILRGSTEGEITQKKKKSAISLFYVRVAVCLVVFGGVIFVKLNNPCLFENFRFWYQNNVCEEKFSATEIKQGVVSALFMAKEKVFNAVSRFGGGMFNH